MLPGLPSSGGSANSGMPPTGHSVQTPESAQHSTNSISEGPDSLMGSPRSRSHSSSYEFMQKMNSILGNAINLNSFMQDASPTSEASNQGGLRTLSGGFGGESELSTPPNRAVGAMRAIRGSGGHPMRTADPCDTTPIKQTPQLSDHLKSILSRQGHGGDFGSLITPLPVSMANSTSANSALAAAAAACQWTPFQVYQNPADGYFGNLNRIDYGPLREPGTWAPLPPVPPSSSSVTHTPGPIARNSPERSASTGSSSSSGVSMSHLTDLIAHLNTNDSSPWPAQYQQSQSTPNDISREWPTVYQLRHGARPPPALPMASLMSTPSPITPPPPIATSATNTSVNQNEYAALFMAAAAANYINNSGSGERAIGGGSMANSNSNLSVSQCDSRYLPPNEGGQCNTTEQQYSIERAARIYRKAATICDATCTWSGQLPANLFTRCVQNVSYSCKVFVGGVPWDVTEAALLSAFTPFGPCRVEWPGKEARYAKSPVKPSAKGKGYVYMIYENERSVKALLDNCARDFAHAGEYYFQLTSRRLRTKEIRQVQIIPWNIGDSNHLRFASQRLDPKKTVFVGALHGMITAEVLSNVLNDLFGGVVYAGIDTDKYKYPIGSGRVTFNNTRSYHKAIAAAFVEIKSAKFSKKVQIDPYLEDATCSTCMTAPGPYFCRELMCFRYFCKTCWHTQHALDVMQSHKPLMRNTRRNQHSQCVAAGFSNFPINNGQQF